MATLETYSETKVVAANDVEEKPKEVENVEEIVPETKSFAIRIKERAPKQPETASKLLDLPDELTTMILSYVIRPTDNRSLCLTCKKLHELTVPQMYKSVTLEIGRPQDQAIAGFLDSANIGLKYVRTLELYASSLVDCKPLTDIHYNDLLAQAHLTTRMLLQFLVPNTLERFSWMCWRPFSKESMALLYKRQKKLINFQAMAVDGQFDEEFQQRIALTSLAPQVTELEFYPDCKEHLKLCSTLLQTVKKLDKLHICPDFNEFPDQRELLDTSTEPGAITGLMFRHLLPFSSCKPVVVPDLSLYSVPVRYARETWCKVIDFTKLKTLQIDKASGADALLAELSKSNNLPAGLETLSVECEEGNDRDSEVLLALESFLCLINGLKSLTIEIASTTGLPQISKLIHHGKSLRRLSVHGLAPNITSQLHDLEEHVYSAEDFERLCKGCTQLEQLSIAFPKTALDNHTTQWRSFATCASQIKTLVALQVTTWPLATVDDSSAMLSMSQYELCLQAEATNFFKANRAEATKNKCSAKLNLVAFGIPEKVFAREDPENCRIFIKGSQGLQFMKEATSICAIPVSWSDRKYLEPRAEILDHIMLKRASPPFSFGKINREAPTWG